MQNFWNTYLGIHILFYPLSCLRGKWIDLLFIFHPPKKWSNSFFLSSMGPDTPQQLGCQMSQLWIELKRRSAQEIEIWQRFVKPQKPPHAAVQNFPIKLPIPLSRKDVIVIWLTCEYFFNSLSPQKKYSLFKICIIIHFSKLYNVLSYLYN